MASRNFLSRIPPFNRRRPLVSVVRMSGFIGRLGPTRAGMTMEKLASAIEGAFTQRGARAVALLVNSPGGSPVQSSLIHNRVRALAQEHELPVFAFIEDVGASGGYWLACAADEIYADANSIVGSIGVISAAFGLNEAIKRLGIERRVHTAGDKKGMLDPFLAEDPADVKHLKSIQAEMHENFKDMVRHSRGEKLSGPESEVFSGAFWTGRQAFDFGLVDGIGELRATMRERFGDKTRFRVFGERKAFLKRRLGLGGGLAAGGVWADEAIAAVEERLLWSRFGL